MVGPVVVPVDPVGAVDVLDPPQAQIVVAAKTTSARATARVVKIPAPV